MQTKEYFSVIIDELNRTADLLMGDEAERLVDAIVQADKIFVAGAGRSGLMSRAFAMRMMQMGFDAYVVGETVTPNLDQGDLLLIGSGSGETRTLVPAAEKARSLQGVVAIATIVPESTIGRIADIVIRLPGATKDQANSTYKTIQPMGALFEQTLLVFFDAVILRLMEKKHMDSGTMFTRHANLE